MSPRELDAWLAEHLFGWHVEGNRRGNWRLVSPSGDVGVMYQRGKEPAYIGYQPPFLPAYSSTGDGMLLVLEAMRGRGWHFEANAGPTVWVGFWNGKPLNHHPRSIRSQSTNASLPLAVALAAKSALEAE